MMGQPKPNPVKKSKCKVGGLKPELKNEMVKKKPAFHWNKPPKPDFLVKTTFFEAKREEFRDFEMPPDSTSPIPGLQIADFTVSRARVRGRSRKVSLDENSLLGASSINSSASKSESSSSSIDPRTNKSVTSTISVDSCSNKTEACVNPNDSCPSSQLKETPAKRVDAPASQAKLPKQAEVFTNSANLPTSRTSQSANHTS